ncbi:MAG: flavodoxin family protein [Proteobacteria bacterium]|nr:flavodoxin family protein [Pseudomonadota bacterium]
MRVLVLTGSHRKNGNSSALASAFIEGAKQSGHDVRRLDCAFLKIGGCMGCDFCMSHQGECVQKDDVAKIREEVIAADAVVFVSPVYYFGISSQLKAAMDRFYAFNDKLMNAHKKTALLLSMADTEMKTAQPSIDHFKAVCDYLGWDTVGVVVASAWAAGSVTEDKIQEARELGEGL